MFFSIDKEGSALGASDWEHPATVPYQSMEEPQSESETPLLCRRWEQCRQACDGGHRA